MSAVYVCMQGVHYQKLNHWCMLLLYCTTLYNIVQSYDFALGSTMSI